MKHGTSEPSSCAISRSNDRLSRVLSVGLGRDGERMTPEEHLDDFYAETANELTRACLSRVYGTSLHPGTKA